MARIPDHEMERLKREVSLLRLVETAGIVLRSQGKDRVGHCPFHEDKTPSFIVSPATNLWHCLGACQAGGTVIDWVMRWHKVSFRHACELLRKDHPALAAVNMDAESAAQQTRVNGSIKPVPQSALRMSASPFSLDDGEQTLLDQVIEYYHRALKQSPDALAYLEKRGLDDAELLTRFRIGYANRTLPYQMAPKKFKAGAELRGALQRIGVLRDSGHEHFNGSLVIPIFGDSGSGTGDSTAVLGVYGRKIRDDLRTGTPKHLYLPGAHRGVWNADGLIDQEEVILCEALIDALTFWRAGYRNVTASYGVNGFTEEYLSTFQQSGIRRVLIAYDRDEAGDRAAETLSTQLSGEGLPCYRLLFPKGMDANAYALAVPPASQSLGVVIRSAVPMNDLALAAVPLTLLRGEPTHDEAIIHNRTSGSAVVNGDLAGATETSHTEPSRAVGRVGGRGGVFAGNSLPVVTGEHRLAPETFAAGSGVGEPSVVDLDSVSPRGNGVAAPLEASVALMSLPAAAVPPAPESDPVAETQEDSLSLTFGERHYRVRGFAKNTGFQVIKANLRVCVGEALHVDTFDLCSAKQRAAFVKHAASETGVDEAILQRDVGKVWLRLEQLQDERLETALKPKTPTLPAMSAAEHAAALAFLNDPALMDRLVADLDRLGLVGEVANTLVGYLACISRKLAAPLAILIQSTSAAGKSALMEAVLTLVPEEDRVQYSAMTGQSLFYLGEKDLKHKILAIAEEEGVRQAAYALKLLQSQGQLTMASTGKDPTTGQLVTQDYRVEGPVMLFLTTTAIDIDEELLNRCLVLTINESREQTRAIQQRQREARTLQGLLAKADTEAVLSVHRNAQRLLRPLAVVNPYAHQLTFVDHRTRTRRDHQKYLTLIDAIALLHQYQRPVRTLHSGINAIEYIEVELTDIALANRLAHDVLGQSLDELPPQTRRLLGAITQAVEQRQKTHALPRSEVKLTRQEIRELSGLSDTRLRLHLERLVEMDYLLAHSGRQGRRFVYELAFDGDLDSNAPQQIGLLDVAMLAAGTTTATSPGSETHLAPSTPATCASLAPDAPEPENAQQANVEAASVESFTLNDKKRAS